jgi:hypothetical protein
MIASQAMSEAASPTHSLEGACPDVRPTLREADETPGEAMTRIARLVAAIKAEREAEGPVRRALETGDRGKLIGLLRQFVAAREQERAEWDETLKELRSALDKAHVSAQAARAELDDQTKRHHQMLADLELKHEHQRSIWLLDRRRLEITIAGLETAREVRGSWFRARLAVMAALVVVGAIGLVLAGDSGSSGAPGSSRSDIELGHRVSSCDVVGCASMEQGRGL